MTRRWYWSAERANRFWPTPRFIIEANCPMVSWFFLWWFGSICLIPHSAEERAAVDPLLGEPLRELPHDLER